jgi:FixJ family two-component response regulator
MAVLFITGKSVSKEFVRDGLQLGAVDFMEKCFSLVDSHKEQQVLSPEMKHFRWSIKREISHFCYLR